MIPKSRVGTMNRADRVSPVFQPAGLPTGKSALRRGCGRPETRQRGSIGVLYLTGFRAEEARTGRRTSMRVP